VRLIEGFGSQWSSWIELVLAASPRSVEGPAGISSSRRKKGRNLSIGHPGLGKCMKSANPDKKYIARATEIEMRVVIFLFCYFFLFD